MSSLFIVLALISATAALLLVNDRGAWSQDRKQQGLSTLTMLLSCALFIIALGPLAGAIVFLASVSMIGMLMPLIRPQKG